LGLLDRFRFSSDSKTDVNIRQIKQTVNENNNIRPAPTAGGVRASETIWDRYGLSFYTILPRRTRSELGLDERRFSSLNVFDLIDILIDAHPDVSFALWNFLRIANSGYTFKVYRINSTKRHQQAEEELWKFLEKLDMPSYDGFSKTYSINKVINQLLLSLITRGAAALEVVLTPDYEDVAYLAPVDPATIDFRYENGKYVPYQLTKRLDIPTFFYEGLDEKVDDPYGRSPFLSALSIVLFQLQVLNDIKAVVHNQGYPRFDITILEEAIINRMPVNIRNNEQEKQKWLRDRLQEIIDMYNSLEPDDSFVHYDSVQIDMVGGKSGGGAVIDPEKLMRAIDNLIMSGLKTLSTILGRRSTGNTESFAKLEIKLYLQGVKSLQDIVANILSRVLTLVLNLKGLQGVVKFKFEPLEIRTDLEQEQFKQIKYLNIAYARDQGWIDQVEAANWAVGHDPVGDPLEPQKEIKNKEGKTPKGTTDTNPDAGNIEDMSDTP